MPPGANFLGMSGTPQQVSRAWDRGSSGLLDGELLHLLSHRLGGFTVQRRQIGVSTLYCRALKMTDRGYITRRFYLGLSENTPDEKWPTFLPFVMMD